MFSGTMELHGTMAGSPETTMRSLGSHREDISSLRESREDRKKQSRKGQETSTF